MFDFRYRVNCAEKVFRKRIEGEKEREIIPAFLVPCRGFTSIWWF